MHHSELINHFYLNKADLSPTNCPSELKICLEEIYSKLNTGEFRVAEKIQGNWQTHAWLKQAILLSFKVFPNQILHAELNPYFDKIPLKFQHYREADFKAEQIRVVPQALVREGCFIGKNTVLMPSYVNVGAYVDEGCMIDTWATVGSCAQIGKNVHISGGAGIGGVLEPVQANPTIIEDHCFIGARSEIVEGVVIEQGSVIGMGVFIGQSTKIYHRETQEIFYGRVPAGSVVVAGSLPSQSHGCQLYCAVIVKQVDEKTRAKTSINQLLRDD